MATIPIQVDTHLRLDDQVLDEAERGLLAVALDVRNPDQPDEVILMLMRDGMNRLVIPRGFAYKLQRGLNRLGHEVVWEDQRVKVDLGHQAAPTPIDGSFTPRPYQGKAIDRMVYVEQGIYEAPPGSGKTISAAHFIARAGQRTIVIVDKINIATQWQGRLHDVLGDDVSIGIIGDGSWIEGDITVAIRQTLWVRRQQLDATDWWKGFGAVILDECHAISAPSVREVFQRFPAYYRIGLSATPDRHDWMTVASRGIIGEIFCRTTDDELEEAGVLVRPKVVAVRTPFEFVEQKMASSNREWTRMMQALRADVGRNTVIAKFFAANRGHACIAHTDQKTHAHELAAYALAHGWPRDRVRLLTGDQSDDERQAIVRDADEGDVLIISTIGQEALDIPRLDRFFLVWPTKNATPVRQMVGRVKRTHADKSEPVVYDFYDHLIGRLNRQFQRRRTTYARDGLDVAIIG